MCRAPSSPDQQEHHKQQQETSAVLQPFRAFHTPGHWPRGAAAPQLTPLSCPEHPVGDSQGTPSVQTPPFARSCPRPIVRPSPGQLPGRSKGAPAHHQDPEDEPLFMPPHQIMAASAADPIQVSNRSTLGRRPG